jgi:ATP-binding cassette subfamily G (WHITE) protein 2 (SNQ2)
LSALLIFSEFNTTLSTDSPVTLYKRGARSKPLTSAARAGDEENATSNANEKEPSADASKAAIVAPRMNDIFTWKNINYTVPIDGGNRQLLSDVSGYVAPGKLTALMGESGAGKTTLLNVLAMRTDTGVVTGDRFVNGQSLPADFQSQSYVVFLIISGWLMLSDQ